MPGGGEFADIKYDSLEKATKEKFKAVTCIGSSQSQFLSQIFSSLKMYWDTADRVYVNLLYLYLLHASLLLVGFFFGLLLDHIHVIHSSETSLGIY